MSLYGDPETHAANPPSTWTVQGSGRSWYVVDTFAGRLGSPHATKRAALAEIESGFLRRLYDDETRWYAGGQVTGWRPYAEIIAERAASLAKRQARLAAAATR